MTFSLVLATLLCFTTWMSSVHTINGPAANCCTFWSTTRVHPKKIMNYTVQPESPCPITAIVFYTKTKRICSDPSTDWAKRAMMKVDKDTKALLEKGQNQEGSASGIITPAMAISSKNTPQRKGRNGKRRQKKRKGRKMQ
ncbi:eotaxin-like [Sphaeramia orbicularis]|uniref:Eotaxin-like n=1 Tax=Sphaeramia orbicularis TaxID=375764 RepID=A0A673AC66_9TELE|nr:eotaxin-like [Sphaeramia orbicularis]